METKIVAFAGGKGSGKTTSMNFLHGYQLRSYRVIENFAISQRGQLIVKTDVEKEGGGTEVADTYLDVNRKDLDFIDWAMYNVWPFVKKYSFADPLKYMAMSLFGLKEEQVYGSQEHKNQVVPDLLRENMPGIDRAIDYGVYEPGPMTVREFLQYLGTDIMRSIDQNVWVNRCLQDIEEEQPILAVIDDCRFPNEVAAIQAAGGKVIGLTRDTEGEDSHASENAFRKVWDDMDYILDNSNKSIHDSCTEIIKAFGDWGWLQEEIVADSKNPKKRKIHKIKENK